MNIEEIRNYCLNKQGVTESFPFDQTTLVFKVGGKMFALLSLEKGSKINLKCDPEYAVELRERYPGVEPGFHMNKKHWNTVDFHSDLPDELLKKWIDHSYDLVCSGLTKKLRRKQDLNK
jgi:predicted DNA-binding protein (MmcQ/YjbR family)